MVIFVVLGKWLKAKNAKHETRFQSLVDVMLNLRLQILWNFLNKIHRQNPFK